MHPNKRKIKLPQPWWPWIKRMKHTAAKVSHIQHCSLSKLAEIYIEYKHKKVSKLITDPETHLIHASKLKSSIHRYRWRTHRVVRERKRAGIFKKIFFTNDGERRKFDS